MRIIAGQHRGLTLADPGKGDPSAHLRPTGDRVREAIFNVALGGRYGNPVQDAVVLDLFAGTGALGLEALSRGAAYATFVDSGRVAQGLIRENLRRTRRESDARLVPGDAARLPPNPGAPATLVFLDPPYGKLMGGPTLLNAERGNWISPGALVIWEEAAAQMAPPGYILADQRRYGDTYVTFLIRE